MVPVLPVAWKLIKLGACAAMSDNVPPVHTIHLLPKPMLPKRIKLRHLEGLLAIAQHRQIGRAAQALAVSQPALSKTLSDLEEIIGIPLIIRSRSGITLTPKGQELLGFAGSSLRTLREGLEQVTGIVNAPAASIVAGILPTVATTVFPDAVLRFRQRHGAVRAQIHTGPYSYMLAQLKRGELDLIAGRQAEPEDMLGLSFEHLYAEPMVFVVRPGHPLDNGSFDLRQLASHCVLLPLEGTAIRRTADAFLTRHAAGPLKDVIETVSHPFAQSYLTSCDAVLFTPLGIVERELKAGMLSRLACDTSSTTAAVGVTLRTDAPHSQAVSAFLACMREAAALHREGMH